LSAVTSGVEDALRLGCAAIGFTIYPGSAERVTMYQELREAAALAKKNGLAVVVWSYPRGGGLSKAGETAMDVCGYAAHIAAELGAHIIKVKLPTDHLEQEAARKVYEKEKVPIANLTERVKHVVQCTFAGRRIVIFSGGPTESDEAVYAEVTAIRQGGGFGSIIGRNSFQRQKEQSLQFLNKIISIYGN
jgi:class I fructose-bisphosphate aldolase